MDAIQELSGKLAQYIINPILILIFGAGLVVFVWGLVEYLYELNIKGEQSEEGKKHMFWGMVGMFIMAAALTIIKIIANTTGGKLPPGY
jgi:hypothetical protein